MIFFEFLIKYIQRLCKNNKIIENHKLIFNKSALCIVNEIYDHPYCCFYMSLKIMFNEKKDDFKKITKNH